jgi:hypothetical protein
VLPAVWPEVISQGLLLTVDGWLRFGRDMEISPRILSRNALEKAPRPRHVDVGRSVLTFAAVVSRGQGRRVGQR